MKIYAYYFPNWHVDKFNEKSHGTGWTEWTEGAFLEPDKTNKYGFLEAIKDVFKSKEV